jgi:hypothetical protein
MGVRPHTIFTLIVVGAFAAACSAHGPVSAPPLPTQTGNLHPAAGIAADVSTAREAASEAAITARVDAKLRSGWIYQIRGTAHGATVALGKDPQFTFGPGDSVKVVLVPNTEPRYRISGTRSRARGTDAAPVQCDTCVDGGVNPTPNPLPSPPPNYAPCAASGGATRFNSSTGDGGCVPRGGSKGLPCGTWSWSSRGRATLKPPNAGIPLADFDWVTVNGDGSCDLGYF